MGRDPVVQPLLIVGVLVTSLWWITPPLLAPSGEIELAGTADANVTVILQPQHVVENTSTTPESTYGVYVPPSWSEDGRAQILLANDVYRGGILITCSHELQHHRLQEAGVPFDDHHERIAADGYAWPWTWPADCYRLLPHLAF